MANAIAALEKEDKFFSYDTIIFLIPFFFSLGLDEEIIADERRTTENEQGGEVGNWRLPTQPVKDAAHKQPHAAEQGNHAPFEVGMYVFLLAFFLENAGILPVLDERHAFPVLGHAGDVAEDNHHGEKTDEHDDGDEDFWTVHDFVFYRKVSNLWV